jgi:hypothetical protein
MGVDYSAAVAYGFAVSTEDIPTSKEGPDCYWADVVENLGIPYHVGGNYMTETVYTVIFSVEGTYTEIDFWCGDDLPYCTKLSVDDINVEDVLELQIRLEQAGIEVSEPSWYMTTRVS